MNMDKMSSEERMKNLYNGKRIDRVPFMSSATMYAGKMMGYTSEEFYFDVKKSYQAQKWVREMHQCDGLPCFDIPNREVLDFQGELVFKKKYTLELPQVIYPVQTISEAEKFHLPSKSRWENLHKNIEFYEYAKSQGETSFGISAGSPLSTVGSMVDASHLLRWMCKEPRIVHKLLQQAETYLLDYAESIINTFGLENCYVYSDMPFESNDLISPKQFREFGLPYIVDIHEKLRKRGIKQFSIHLCGNQMHNLEGYNELKLEEGSVVSSDEKNPLKEVSQILGNQYIYAGNVSTSLLVSCTPDKVYSHCKEIIDVMKYVGRGFILQPSCDLPLNVKSVNLYAMLKACRDFGKYIDI